LQGHGIQNNVRLSNSEIAEELIMMGTRLSTGVNEDSLLQLTKLRFIDVFNYDIVNDYVTKRLITTSDNRLRLTEHGLLLHNYLIPRLLSTSL